MRSAVLSASFLSVALVLGEFTIASLLNRTNLQVAIDLLGKRNAQISVAVRWPRWCFAFVLLFVLSFVGGARRDVAARPTAAHRKELDVTAAPTADDTGRARPPRGVAVELTGLHRSFGPVQRARRPRPGLAPGELVALLGPSGCGKTTALRCLAGLEDPDSGRIVVGGKDLDPRAGQQARHGHGVPGLQPVPAPDRPGERRVRAAAAPPVAASSGARRAARDARAGRPVAAQADRYAHQLSGGQQQRVALARALAIQPQVLLLDEPLSALDAKVRVQLRDEIRRIQLEVGTTTLFVTHDQEEALAVADRVGVMRSGRLEQIAAPEELYSRPATTFVADFVGLTNRLPGRPTRKAATVLGQLRAPARRLGHVRDRSRCWCDRNTLWCKPIRTEPTP